MADEKVEQTEASPETQAEETQAAETPEVQKPETVEPEKADQEQTEQTEETATEEPPRKYKLKVDGAEEEHSEDELIELAQKGVKFTKNQQALAEQERALQERASLGDQMLNDPLTWRIAMARKMQIDPSVILTNPVPPNPNLESVDPQAYYQQAAQFNLQTQQRQAVENALGQYAVQLAQTNNAALFAKARSQHDLNDQQLNEVAVFVGGQFRPNAIGMFSEQQIQYAVSALYGKEKIAKAKLDTANNIREKIKTGTSTAPAKPTRDKHEELPADVAESRKYLEFIRERNKGG